ncbi:MAG: prepilin-type N-terminal cleavage/methylation domain-containing protein [Rickettsiales bacterium]|nr:prepilin-type N-terminal cleavage/methylation domain-containing protein [Rickettsiales bacterium]
MKKLFRKKLRAFSLIELSVVILVIGILVAGVAGGSKLITTFRLQSAQTLTLSSPVATTKGLVLWLESSMPESFLSAETEDGSQLTKWLDRNPQATTKFSANATASAGITFKAKSNIYDLPAVYFNGSSAAVFTLSNGIANAVINTPDNAYTFFIVAKLDDDSASTVKTIFSNGGAAGWGYGVSGSQGSRSRRLIFAGATDVTSATANATTNVEVVSASYTGGAGGSLQLFTNGVGAAGTGEAGTAETLSASIATAQTPTTAFYIGNKSSAAPWTGQVAEIIIFNRSLSTKERNQIELYLGQKYGIKTAATGNVDGCPVNVAGVLTTHVSEGSSTFNCLAAGYSGSVPYTCSGSTLTTSTICGVAQCTITGQTGITDGTAVAYGTTSRTCDAGFTGSVTYNSCAGAAAVVTNNTCTPITCPVSGVTGLSGTVNYGTTSKACNAGYTGTVNYTCSAGGVFNYVSGTCTLVTCTVSGVTGLSGTVNYGTTSKSCNAGYTGTINYTCSSGGAFNYVSGTCTAIPGHWVLESSNVYSSIGYGQYGTSDVCESSYNGKYAIVTGGVSTSGPNISASGGNHLAFPQTCYCTTNGCSPVCSGSYTFMSSMPMYAYKCVYP